MIKKLYKYQDGGKPKKRVIFAEAPKKDGKTDSTFIEEAKIISKASKQIDGIPTEIVPIYGKEEFDAATKKYNKEVLRNSDVIILGHAGTKIAGVDNSNWDDYLKDSMDKNRVCYGGICDGNIMAFDLKNVPNFTGTVDTSWLGIPRYKNFKGKGTFDEIFFSNSEEDPRESKVTVIKPKYGKNYANFQKSPDLVEERFDDLGQFIRASDLIELPFQIEPIPTLPTLRTNVTQKDGGKLNHIFNTIKMPIAQDGVKGKLTKSESDLYDKYKAYVGSNIYRSRLQNFRTPEQAQEEQYTSLDRLRRAKPPVISPVNLPKQIQGWYEMPAMLDGIGSIILSPKRSKYAFTHEMDHLNRAGGNRYNNSELAILKLMNREGSNIPKDQLDYLQDPTESGARLSNIRAGAVEYGIHKDFGEEFTKEQLQELIEKTKGEKVFEFIQAYNPEELLQALNTIADSGEQQEINISRNGGEIQKLTMKNTKFPIAGSKFNLQQGGYGELQGDAGKLLLEIMKGTTMSGMFNPIQGQDQFNRFLPITQNMAGLFDLQQRERSELENKKLRVQDFPTSSSSYAPAGFAQDGGGIELDETNSPSLQAIMKGLPKGMSKKHKEMVVQSAKKEILNKLLGAVEVQVPEQGIPQAGLGDFFSKVGKGIKSVVKGVGNVAHDWGTGIADSFGNSTGLYDIDNSKYKTGLGRSISGFNDQLHSTTGQIGRAIGSAVVPGLSNIYGGGNTQNQTAQTQQQVQEPRSYSDLEILMGMMPSFIGALQSPTQDNYSGFFKEGGRPQQKLGYKRNSPYKNLPFQNFTTDTITMDDVDKKLLAIADTGEVKVLKPNSGLHRFLGATNITEVPMAQDGAYIDDEFEAHGLRFRKPKYGSGYYFEVGDRWFPFDDYKSRTEIEEDSWKKLYPENIDYMKKSRAKIKTRKTYNDVDEGIPYDELIGQVEYPRQYSDKYKDENGNFLEDKWMYDLWKYRRKYGEESMKEQDVGFLNEVDDNVFRDRWVEEMNNPKNKKDGGAVKLKSLSIFQKGGQPTLNIMKNYQDGGTPTKYANLEPDQKAQYFTSLQNYVKNYGFDALESSDSDAAEFYKNAALEVVLSNEDDNVDDMEETLPEIEFTGEKSRKNKKKQKTFYNPNIGIEIGESKYNTLFNDFGIKFEKIGTTTSTNDNLRKLTETLQRLISEGQQSQQMIFDPRDYRSGGRISSYRQGGIVFNKDLIANEESKTKSYINLPLLIPIQTEVKETIVLPDGSLTKVNAKKRHSKMTDNEVTDIVPESSYVLSQFGDTKIYKEEAKQVVLEMKAEPYNIHRASGVPQAKSLGDIMKHNVMSPADLSRVVNNKFKVVEGDDPFLNQTNEQNKFNRTAYLQAIIGLSEYDKARKGIDNSISTQMGAQMVAKHGGKVMTNYKVPKAVDPVSAVIAAIPQLANIGFNVADRITAKKNRKLNDADIDAYGNTARRNLGFSTLSNSLGVMLQNPEVTPAIYDTNYLDAMNSNNMAYLNNVSRRAATDAFNNRLDTSSMSPQMAMLLGERDNAMRYEALGKTASELAKTRGDLFAKYMQMKQATADKNVDSRVSAKNLTQAALNSQVGTLGGIFAGAADTSTNIEANLLNSRMANRGNYAANISQLNSSLGQSLQNAANVGLQMYTSDQAAKNAEAQNRNSRTIKYQAECQRQGFNWICAPDGICYCDN